MPVAADYAVFKVLNPQIEELNKSKPSNLTFLDLTTSKKRQPIFTTIF